MPRINPDRIRICKVCGEEYHPKSARQQSCNKPIVIQCEVCGKDIETICTTAKTKTTCSKECAAALIKQRREESAKSLKRTCKWCGKEFIPKSVRDGYCRETHYQTCEVCGKQFVIDVRKDPYVRSCSKECKKVLQVKNRDFEVERQHQMETLMAKYGVENSAQIPGAMEKAKQTNLEKYGVEWYTQTQEYKDRVKATSQENYGYDHFLQSPEVIGKRKATWEEIYGFDNAAKSDIVKEHIVDSLETKYGVDNPGKLPQAQKAIKEFWNDRERIDLAKIKREETNMKKFGAAYVTQTIDSRLNQGFDLEHAERLVEFYRNPEQYILDHFEDQPTAYEVSVHFMSKEPLNKLSGSPVIKWYISSMEQELSDFIISLDSSIYIKHNDRTQIAPLELDLYLPEYKIAFECNPTYTHNSSVGAFESEPLSISYHSIKSKLCEEKGIFLFHIFGYEWSHRKAQIFSMIRNLLGKNEHKVYGRSCEVRAVNTLDCKNFLNENHRQGYTTSKVNLGLYYQDQLVALMTFGKLRVLLGVDNQVPLNCWELVRFCTLQNYNVIGGASKLFKYFIDHYGPNQIRSFSDIAHTRGTLYEILGFKYLRYSNPHYVWVDELTDIAYNHINTQKKNLKKFLKDDTIDLSKTEKQIMEEHGYLQVFDSGTITWEWRRN